MFVNVGFLLSDEKPITMAITIAKLTFPSFHILDRLMVKKHMFSIFPRMSSAVRTLMTSQILGRYVYDMILITNFQSQLIYFETYETNENIKFFFQN